MIKVKRVYEAPSPSDGERILVERLWPRGLSKERAALDLWLKEIAPSPELRVWFHHDPALWDEFCRRYWAELDQNPAPVQELRARAQAGVVSLLYAAHDTEHNSAVALERYLVRSGRANAS